MRLGYDRGTILVHGLPTDSPLVRLAGLLWDNRVGCHRAPAWRHAELIGALRRRGEAFTNEVLSSRDEPLPAWPPLELRPYQQAALAAWQTGGMNGILVLPTGSGKTRVACAAIRATGARTLCLAPTRALVQQWRGELGRFSGLQIGCFGDGQQELRPVTVATFESAFRHMAALGRHFELLVVDEVHHFGNGGRDEALELCAAPLRLGLTATGPTGVAADRVDELVGPRIFELTVRDLAGRYLAELDLIVMRLALTCEERADYEREVGAFRSLFARCGRLPQPTDWGQFVRAAAESSEGRAALSAWRRARRLLGLTAGKRAAVAALLDQHRDHKVLIFTADNESAYAIAREQLIMPITCEIAKSEREHALERFKRGTLRALVSARVLNEGIDVPDAEVAIVVGGALGQREHVQRVGRLLRPAPGKRALVYELVTSATREVRQSAERRRGLAA
jgi:superfamily II DNA or RNA helicase